MNHVKANERIKAETMNWLIDQVQGTSYSAVDEQHSEMPESFAVYVEADDSGSITSLNLVNNFVQMNGAAITAADKAWENDFSDITSLYALQRGSSLSVASNKELEDIPQSVLSNITQTLLFDVEFDETGYNFTVLSDYRDAASSGPGGGGGSGTVVPDMSSLNYVEETDTSAQISVAGTGTDADPFIVKSTNSDGTIREQVLDPSGRNTLQNPGWVQVSNDIREYWVNGGVLRGGTTPLEEGWAKGGTMSNPYWQKGGTIGNPYWKQPNSSSSSSGSSGSSGGSGSSGSGSSSSNSDNAKVIQNWNYNTPLADDRVDITEVSALNDYSFLVRPEPYGGTLKYANLSAVISGGGGGGGCSCDVTAYFESGDKLATWTNGAKTVDIYSNVLSNDVRDIRNRVGYTPFFYDVSQQRIINNFFYVNRTLHEIHSSGYIVDQYGTYYLKISHYASSDTYEIVQDTYTGLDTGGKQNTDTETYYKLWTITPNLIFDWRQAPCIPFYERD